MNGSLFIAFEPQKFIIVPDLYRISIRTGIARLIGIHNPFFGFFGFIGSWLSGWPDRLQF